jgi:hypothetical protein
MRSTSLFQPPEYKLERENDELRFLKNGQKIAQLFVDATDNRITLTSIDESLGLDDIRNLTTELDNHFGAKQIFKIPDSLKSLFMKFHYYFDPTAQKSSERLRETTVNSLIKIDSECNMPEGCAFVSGKKLLDGVSQDNINALMTQSKFLEAKIQQYQLQGYEGFQLMCHYSTPYGIKNKEGKLLAFCRITDLKNGEYYLSDTFVDENVFKTKAIGTAYLYKQVGHALHELFKQPNLRLLLIAPPFREEEFDKHYGCKSPSHLAVKFGPAKPELQEVFNEEVKRCCKVQHTTLTYSS